ncbi:unnamed protein product [Caenorhabditis angaria]|uniref:Alpha/beta hydrolase fold-3 domain-containing protein n=1 Tax=Caenorhabditis angaria TaxID=860376 RepID=A0A9P1N987_9PELO|nr:unnamed protein product [Caenorhabditis angaria]
MTDWLYWILIFLFFAGSLFLLHIPLPHDISDRSKLAVAEFLLRMSNEYFGDLVENLFGSVVRNKLSRFILKIGFLMPPKEPMEIKRREVKIGGVPCITYEVANRKSDGLLVFIHGGGWCVGEAAYYDDCLYKMLLKLRMNGVSIDYRLAPEHPFPAGLDDCESVILSLYHNGCENLEFNRNKIIVQGDSAGGNLTATVCQRLHRKNEKFVKAQVLIYPVTHVFNFNSPSYQEYWKKYSGTALLNPKHMARWILLYLGLECNKKTIKKLLNSQHLDADFENSETYQELLHYDKLPEKFKNDHTVRARRDVDSELAAKFQKVATNPDCSPIFGDCHGLPPALVLTAGYDVLRDEGIQYAQKLENSGVKTKWIHFPRAYHGLFNMPNSEDRLEMMHEIVNFMSFHI